eukprot:TRINITY_DN13374_c0_g1_i2.p1 TRINITY_DN13374_c0_g1~~TRINITY_DN13374_c0_g1_i2.p1  ORF type:complete len:135 (-),score=26.38 TRINITY_DN13374_c0_g1_i2:23-427(-)
MQSIGAFTAMQSNAFMLMPNCCQHTFTWMWPEEYGDAPLPVHGQVLLSPSLQGPNLNIDRSGTCTGQGIAFATEAIQQDRVYFEFTVMCIDGPVWFGVGRHGDNTQMNALPPVCLLYTSPSPRDRTRSRMPSSA